MIRKLENKKGDKLLSVYWFAILVIVAVGIVLMVNTFYGKDYDVRKDEATILAQKAADCIYPSGKLNPEAFSSQSGFREDFRDKFLDKCSMNFSIKDTLQRPPYYIEVGFFSEGNLDKQEFLISHGNKNWKGDCENSASDRTKLATCVSKEFYAKGDSDTYYLVKILSIVGKVEENTN